MDDVTIAGDETRHDERLMKFLERASKKRLKTKQRDPPEGSALCRTSTHRRGPED